jgi:hypothetical protein
MLLMLSSGSERKHLVQIIVRHTAKLLGSSAIFTCFQFLKGGDFPYKLTLFQGVISASYVRLKRSSLACFFPISSPTSPGPPIVFPSCCLYALAADDRPEMCHFPPGTSSSIARSIPPALAAGKLTTRTRTSVLSAPAGRIVVIKE